MKQPQQELDLYPQVSNRGVIQLIPTKLYVDWLNYVNNYGINYSINDLEPISFLIELVKSMVVDMYEFPMYKSVLVFAMALLHEIKMHLRKRKGYSKTSIADHIWRANENMIDFDDSVAPPPLLRNGPPLAPPPRDSSEDDPEFHDAEGGEELEKDVDLGPDGYFNPDIDDETPLPPVKFNPVGEAPGIIPNLYEVRSVLHGRGNYPLGQYPPDQEKKKGHTKNKKGPKFLSDSLVGTSLGGQYRRLKTRKPRRRFKNKSIYRKRR